MTPDEIAMILSGHLVINDYGRFYFDRPGENWILSSETPDEAKLHREDGPAIEYTNGTTEYWVNGQRHRTDGPAIEYPDGDFEYWVNGRLHRTDGPAVTYKPNKAWWYLDGEYREPPK